MGDKRGWGHTVLGWLVVQDPVAGSAEPDTDALIKKYSEPPAPMPITLEGPLPSARDGALDFGAVYQAAGIAIGERERVAKAQTLITTLPADAPAATQKQIVEASLKAFGVPTEKIIEAGVQEIQALEAFLRAGQGDAQKLLADGSARIEALQKDVLQVKAAMEQAIAEQEARARITNAEKLKIQEVLEFFGREAVAKVVEDSPKLHTPPSN